MRFLALVSRLPHMHMRDYLHASCARLCDDRSYNDGDCLDGICVYRLILALLNYLGGEAMCEDGRPSEGDVCRLTE